MSSDGPAPVRYRHAPKDEAWQVTPENVEQVARWCDGLVVDGGEGRREVMVPDRNDAGLADWARPGQWVVKRGADPTVVVDPEVFDRGYAILERPTRIRVEVRAFETTSGSYRLTHR